MIEVLFGEREAAAVKAAKNITITGYVNGPTSVWMIGKKAPPQSGTGGWINGTTEQVICLDFMLDIGDIREPADSRYRKKIVDTMYSENQYPKGAQTDRARKQAGEFYSNELVRLKKYLDRGEAVRIWYSDAPYSICGFYSLCRMMQDYTNEVRTVKLPEYEVKETGIQSYRNWDEISAEQFAGFLSEEKILTAEEVRWYALLWSELTEDNSPLRAVINGRITGVSEEFYDFLIWKKLTDKPVREERLLEDIIGSACPGVSGMWLAGRIEHYIRQGNIQVVENCEDRYARIIRLAGGFADGKA